MVNDEAFTPVVAENGGNVTQPHDEVNLYCMEVAILESTAAVTEDGCMPFGAVLVDNTTGQIVLRARNAVQRAAQRGGGVGTSDGRFLDVTRHAETELVRKMTLIEPPSSPSTYTIYTSTEPCVMCAGAIYWQRKITRIVYGCSAARLETEVTGPGGFDIPIRQLYYGDTEKAKGLRVIEIVGPVLEEESLNAHRQSGVWGTALDSTNKSVKSCDADAPKMSTSAAQDVAVEAALKASGLGSAEVVDDGVVPV